MIRKIKKLNELGEEHRIIKNSLPVFATEEFLKSKGSEFGWIADNSFITPFLIDKRGGFRRMVLTNEPVPLSEQTLCAEQEHMEKLCIIAKNDCASDFITCQGNAVFRTVPKKSISADWGSYIVDLQGNEDNLLKNMQARTRTKVRKAIKTGVEVMRTDSVNEIYKILKSTMVRQNELYYPSKEYLGRLKSNLKENIQFFLCSYNGVNHGGVVMPFNKHGGYYYYGGSIPQPLDGSLACLHLEIMKYLKEQSVPLYDLMGARMLLAPGSKQIGIHQFKHRLGGKLHMGKSFKVVLRPLRYTMFIFLLKTYFLLKRSFYKGDLFDQIRRTAAMQDFIKAPGSEDCIRI